MGTLVQMLRFARLFSMILLENNMLQKGGVTLKQVILSKF